MSENRKRIWIDPFQTGLLARIVVYLIVYQLILWVFFALCERMNDALLALGVDWLLLGSRPVHSVLALLFLGPILVLDAVRFAHRLVGPLYRFRKTIQAIAAGEPVAPVQLRQGDLLLDFKEDFNLMLKALEQKGLVVLKAPQKPVEAEASASHDTSPATGPRPQDVRLAE